MCSRVGTVVRARRVAPKHNKRPSGRRAFFGVQVKNRLEKRKEEEN